MNTDLYKYLELGPEKNRHTAGRSRFNRDWLTLGRSQKTEIDITCDLEEPWPIPKDQKFEIVYASHVLEHIRETSRFLDWCWHVLCDGGLLRLAVPDARWLMQRYLNNQTDLDDCIEQLRSYKPWMHAQPFDRPRLKKFLEKSKFDEIRFPESGGSASKMMRSDYFSTRSNRSIYVEARK